MTIRKNTKVVLKPQTIDTQFLSKDEALEDCSIQIKVGKHENCIYIGGRDLFFDKDGNSIRYYYSKDIKNNQLSQKA